MSPDIQVMDSIRSVHGLTSVHVTSVESLDIADLTEMVKSKTAQSKTSPVSSLGEAVTPGGDGVTSGWDGVSTGGASVLPGGEPVTTGGKGVASGGGGLAHQGEGVKAGGEGVSSQREGVTTGGGAVASRAHAAAAFEAALAAMKPDGTSDPTSRFLTQSSGLPNLGSFPLQSQHICSPSSSSLLLSSLESSDTQSLCASNTSPPRNRCTYL